MVPSPSPVEMSVLSADGIVLKGILEYPDTRPTGGFPLAILAHQYPATADCFGPLVEDLLDLGVACLAFDERGHGASIKGPDGFLVIDTPAGFSVDDFGQAFVSSVSKVGFHRIDDDIIRVGGWGVSQNFIDPGRILLVGGSVGGSGALLAAPRIPGLKCLITLGAAGAPAFGPDGPDRIRKAVASMTAPTFLASSQSDAFAGADNVRNWSQGLAHVSTRLVPGNAHAMGIYYDIRDELIAFVKATLLKA
jgi:alpha-beta hydrolase superfamily lysophospholipase